MTWRTFFDAVIMAKAKRRLLLLPEAPPVPCEKPKKKAAHFERPRFQSESKIYEKLLSTGRSRVHIHIQQHMAMLLAEAGLVNKRCI